MVLPGLCTSAHLATSPPTSDSRVSRVSRDIISPSRDLKFSKIRAEVADINNSLQQIKQKQRSLKTMVENYHSHDYTFYRIRVRAKRLKDSKIKEIRALESLEPPCSDRDGSFRSKHYSDGSSGSSKSFYEEVEEMMEEGQLDLSEISEMMGVADSSGDSSVFES